MRVDGLLVGKEGTRTAGCGMLLDPKGELVGGVADMGITKEVEGEEVIISLLLSISKFGMELMTLFCRL